MAIRQRLPNRRELQTFEFRHDGIGYIASIGFFPDGRIAEVFLDCEKKGSAAETAARDSAVLASLCLQHDVPFEVIWRALVKLADGSSAGPLG